MKLNAIAAFATDFLRAAGWRAYASGALMVLLGLLDGIGLMLLLPLLAAAGVSTGGGVALPGFLTSYVSGAGLRLESIVLIYLVVVLGYASLKLAVGQLNATLIQRYSADTRIRVHARLTQMSWREILAHKGADVAHALTTNVDTLTRGVLGLLQFASSTVLFVVQFAVALYLSATLAAGAMAVLIIGAFAGRRLTRKVFRDAQATVAIGKLLHHGAEDFVRRHRHVRAFDNETQSHREFSAQARAHSQSVRDIQRAMGQTQFLTEASAVLLIALTFYVGFSALQVPLASLVVFTVVLARLLPRAMALQREAQVVAAALPARAALNFIPQLTVIPAKAGIQSLANPPDNIDRPIARIKWEGLSYRMEDLRWRVDQLELEQGKLSALVGPSGIGKSVLCDVLAGLLPPEAGVCAINGAPLPQGSGLSNAVRLGYLAQHSRPWQATVGAALRWAADGATDADCWAALEQAGLAATMRSRDGLATPLGDAALWLSGGELHRLALAQVLMRKPQVLILDEPSAALDAETELRLVETIRRLALNQPVLVITHRESVARAADRVWTIREAPDGIRSVVPASVGNPWPTSYPLAARSFALHDCAMTLLDPTARYQRRPDIHFTELPTGGIALLDAKRSVFHGSNPVGKRIWDLLAEPRGANDVITILQREYAVEPKRCEIEVMAYFDQLLAQEVITRCE